MVRFSPLIDWQRKIEQHQQQQLHAVFPLNFPKHFEILSEINFPASPEASGENGREGGREIIS